jgi:3-oxoacyl-[acyl-carrier-protein] synthase-3
VSRKAVANQAACVIEATGMYVPDRVLNNHDLEKIVDTSDEWIRTRTGIVERRIGEASETSGTMGAHAARQALERAGIAPQEVDLVICATITPDMPFPSTASVIQAELGAFNAACFDMEAACAGFIYALQIGAQFLYSGTYDTVLVIGAEKMSSVLDWSDRNTCVLFGDGAGAAVLRRDETGTRRGLISTILGADGRYGSILSVPGGGSKLPPTVETVQRGEHFLKMSGAEVYKQAVLRMQQAASGALKEAGVAAGDLKLLIPHQANRRIIQALVDRLGLRDDQVFINLDRYGNTSAASVIMALHEAVEQGALKRGDLFMFAAFGAGLSWAASLMEY